ncbi:MAG: DUF1987 domain-containing protein [Flavobacteriales bacterium]|jgi:hypothetical protein|nr:DUF1987 domain-containing protein [Flavobacteriales bacterium]
MEKPKTLHLESTTKSPEVYCNSENGEVMIKGVSILEDAVSFFTPLKEWIQSYAQFPKNNVNFTLDMEYYNTSTSRVLLDLFRIFLPKEGDHGCKIVWFYDEDDWEMREAGEEYKLILGDTFILQSKAVNNQ